MFVLSVVFLYCSKISGYYRCNTEIGNLKRYLISEVPKSEVSKVDNYIIGKVGKEYFKKNYEFRRDLSRRKDNIYGDDYKLIYDFLPLYKYRDNANITLGLNGEVVYDRNNLIPDCNKTPSYCEFNLTEKELAKLKKEYDFIEGMRFEPPYLIFYICGVGGDKKAKIDYRNGEVQLLPFEESSGKVLITPCDILRAPKGL